MDHTHDQDRGNPARDWLARHGALACIAMMFLAMLPLALMPRPGWAAMLLAALAIPLAVSCAARLDRGRRASLPPLPEPAPVRGHAIVETIDEALVAGEGCGIVGVVEFADFERLAAFDPSLAQRALAVLAERIARMVGPRRPAGPAGRARFAIWFGGEVEETAASAELEAIRYALAAAIELDGQTLTPELRIIAVRAGADESAGLLVQRAVAMLSARAPAGARDEADRAARHAFALEQDLRQAVARNELRLEFQPLIDGSVGRVCGAEALLRWRHPELGLIPPAEFIPVAETAGLAEEIGLWVLNSATREARGWQALGAGELAVAVNVSAQQLARGDLALSVERTLARQRLAPQLLELELTETVAAGDVAHIAQLFQRLRSIGVRIAIDDFGTGYSSLSYLRTLSFDKLKIDREFVTEVDLRRDSQAICQSIIALARGLGIRVLAEGVERREEFEWLRRHGCGLFQGYFFARPLGAADFAAFAADRAGVSRMAGVDPAALQKQIVERLRA